MSAQAWLTLAGLIATVVVVPAFKLLIRIDRRLYSIASNHLPHLYERMMQLDGKQAPSLEDVK